MPGNLELLEKSIAKLENEKPDSNEGIGCGNEFHNLKQLQEYVNDGPFDWVSKCRGLQYEMMCESDYLVCKQVLEEGYIVVLVYVDHDMISDFEDEIAEYASIVTSDG